MYTAPIHCQVPLGVLLKSEQTTVEMVEIMDSLHHYVPKRTIEGTVHGQDYIKEFLHPIFFGGDQLTCARARSSQRARTNADTSSEALCGLVPCCEDWHAKVSFLSVSRTSYMHYIPACRFLLYMPVNYYNNYNIIYACNAYDTTPCNCYNIYRSSGRGYTRKHHFRIRVHSTISEMSSIEPMSPQCRRTALISVKTTLEQL